jgi:hypothetical protein
VQGDVEARFVDFCNKDLKEYKIPEAQILFEDGGNKKTKK